ncbi:ribonuclease E/G [Roseomonas sp. CECT 9278]|uniref:ribonuclease E/G n=1 Tax=Roseomonas sp. CECT 9278 TaxID=2845823 RepID=UPI001E59248A|nr:ribonuclease E/G [Roseomonas sp. CECT 9278]CAH0221079.1 Ribonuclease E [Roseomonas sp. CECT 9278]
MAAAIDTASTGAPSGASSTGAPSGATILVSVSPGEVRTALLQGGIVTEAWVERAAHPDGVGDLQRGRVTAVAPAMAGAFVALAGGETGFLPESESGDTRRPIAQAVNEGMILPLRVSRAAQGGKGPRVSARLTPDEFARVAAAPHGAPRLVARGADAATRLALRHARAAIIVDDLASAAALRGRFGDRVRHQHHPAFDDTLEAAFDELAGPTVALPGGGRLLIHPTPALVAIDMDAGSAAGARGSGAVAALNLAALPVLARQIRARNLAGPILVDFAGLSPRRRAALDEPLKAALAADPMVRLLGFTKLGMAELVRERVHPPLHEVLGWPESALTRGLAALRRAAREAAARPGRRLALRATPAVLAAIEAEPGALAAFTAAAGVALVLLPDATATLPAIEDAPHG